MKKRSTFIVTQLHRSAVSQVGLRKVRADTPAGPSREATALIPALIEHRIRVAFVPLRPGNRCVNTARQRSFDHSIPIEPHERPRLSPTRF